MKILWVHGNNHGVVEDVERPAAEAAIGSGMAVLFGDADIPAGADAIAELPPAEPVPAVESAAPQA